MMTNEGGWRGPGGGRGLWLTDKATTVSTWGGGSGGGGVKEVTEAGSEGAGLKGPVRFIHTYMPYF